MTFHRSRDRGLSLLELLISLAITGVAIAGVGYFMTRTKTVLKEQDLLLDWLRLRQNIEAQIDCKAMLKTAGGISKKYPPLGCDDLTKLADGRSAMLLQRRPAKTMTDKDGWSGTWVVGAKCADTALVVTATRPDKAKPGGYLKDAAKKAFDLKHPMATLIPESARLCGEEFVQPTGDEELETSETGGVIAPTCDGGAHAGFFPGRLVCDSATYVDVTFSRPFAERPEVVVSYAGGLFGASPCRTNGIGVASMSAENITEKGFRLRCAGTPVDASLSNYCRDFVSEAPYRPYPTPPWNRYCWLLQPARCTWMALGRR